MLWCCCFWWTNSPKAFVGTVIKVVESWSYGPIIGFTQQHLRVSLQKQPGGFWEKLGKPPPRRRSFWVWRAPWFLQGQILGPTWKIPEGSCWRNILVFLDLQIMSQHWESYPNRGETNKNNLGNHHQFQCIFAHVIVILQQNLHKEEWSAMDLTISNSSGKHNVAMYFLVTCVPWTSLPSGLVEAENDDTHHMNLAKVC